MTEASAAPTQGPHGNPGLGHVTKNVGTGERWLSALAGGALLAFGIVRGYKAGIAAAVAGGVLVIRGVTGRSLLYRLVGLNRADGTYPTVQQSLTINRPAAEIYAFWRNFENLPQFMEHLEAVKVQGRTHSHWVAKVPFGAHTEWDAEIVEDRPNELIRWRSVPDATVYNAGSIRFQQLPGDRGTEVHITFEYEPPAGVFGALVAKVTGEEPNLQVESDLRRFKQLLEAREIPTTVGQPSARRGDEKPGDVGDPANVASRHRDEVDQASAQSFPASDPPAWRDTNGADDEPRASSGRRSMKALCWYGKADVRVETVPDPEILNPRDAIIKVTATAICGSDLHLYDHYIPTMEKGDILGHEFMGEVVELGRDVTNLRIGDRVIVPFTIACGNCWFCQHQLWSLCDNSNPNARLAEELYGHSPSGLFGYSHLLGGYAGGQAEYVRVPFADVGPMRVPLGLADEQVLFLTDIFPTGYMAAENCNIKPGDTVAVWGCGPVGQFAIKSAYLLGADRVIAIDHVPERLAMAHEQGKAEPLNYDEVHVLEALDDLTGGRGPDACIDAVGLEAHGMSIDAVVDQVKAATFLATDRPHVLREAIMACRKGGTVSVPGVYGGLLDKIPFGAAFSKGLTFKMGQTHVHRYLHPLLERIEKGEIDPSFVITHRMKLEEAPHGYAIFHDKEDKCIKIVLKP